MDPSGLYSLSDAVASLCSQQITCHPSPEQTFEEWLRLERGRPDWWKDLPKCPCSLWITDSGLIPCGAKRAWRPNPTDWERPGVPSIPEARLHPGAKYSMRSKSVDGHSNQCTYDENGNLFTEPPTAGSVDNNTPGTFGHVGNDVDPAGLANTLDGGCHVSWWNPFAPCVMQIPAGQHVLDYYSVRPSWHDNCPKK